MSEQLLHVTTQTCQQLLDCLQEEFRALAAREYETVMSLAQSKQTLVDQLNELDGQIHALPGLTRHARWPALRALLQQCKQQNDTNGQLLNRSFQLTREALGILTGRNTNNTLYSPSGLQQSTSPVLENITA